MILLGAGGVPVFFLHSKMDFLGLGKTCFLQETEQWDEEIVKVGNTQGWRKSKQNGKPVLVWVNMKYASGKVSGEWKSGYVCVTFRRGSEVTERESILKAHKKENEFHGWKKKIQSCLHPTSLYIHYTCRLYLVFSKHSLIYLFITLLS